MSTVCYKYCTVSCFRLCCTDCPQSDTVIDVLPLSAFIICIPVTTNSLSQYRVAMTALWLWLWRTAPAFRRLYIYINDISQIIQSFIQFLTGNHLNDWYCHRGGFCNHWRTGIVILKMSVIPVTDMNCTLLYLVEVWLTWTELKFWIQRSEIARLYLIPYAV